jgi:uncharacterized damage-inducible protein DinB
MNDPLRDHLSPLLDWTDAHATFDAAVRDFPSHLRGRKPEGLPHSPWELLEHIRLAQRDILDFCVAPKYEEHAWPDDYWPREAAPPSAAAWEESVRSCLADREELKKLARDASIDLFAAVPNGTGQTYLRELLLVADHNAYHVGQLVLARRALGAWPS